MSKVLFYNGYVYKDHSFQRLNVLAEDGKITHIGEWISDPEAERVDLKGRRLVPGFLDIHTHGAAGVDVNSADTEGYEKICRFMATQGTTEWLGSVLTDTREQTLACIEAYKDWKAEKGIEHDGAVMMGIHLEGPFLCSEYKGAMPEHLLQAKNIPLVEEYQKAAEGDIRYITVSPEVDGMVEDIPKLKELGIQVAIGHSGADYDTARAAIANGAMAATHTGNAMKLLHQHFPAIWGAVLEDDNVYCEVICDGLHLHPGTVRLILKTKGLDRVVAITDSIMAAGLPDGNYKLGVNDVVVVNGDAKLADGGSRAGSTLTTGRALQNLLAFTGKPVEDILPLLTENPAKLIGVDNQYGFVKEGLEANFVILDETCKVAATFVKGRKVFEA
ncbi:MAG: N-acetylglucosamine-6-phosphate deacetylase [Lachnospiraceae bacterium]